MMDVTFGKFVSAYTVLKSGNNSEVLVLHDAECS